MYIYSMVTKEMIKVRKEDYTKYYKKGKKGTRSAQKHHDRGASLRTAKREDR